MKAKVIIENGESRIELIPENTFEKSLVENFYSELSSNEVSTSCTREYKFGTYENYKIRITLSKKNLSKENENN